LSKPSKNNFRPDPTNRDESIGRIVDGLTRFVDTSGFLKQKRDYVVEVVENRIDFVIDFETRPLLEAGMYAHQLASAGVVEIFRNNATKGWSDLNLAVYYARIYASTHRATENESMRRRGQHSFDDGTDASVPLYFAGLSCLPAEMSSRWGGHLFSKFKDGGLAPRLGDDEVYEFQRLILRALVEGDWPNLAEINHLHVRYADLFRNAENSTEFSEAMIRYCDYRLSRSFLYEDEFAKKYDRSAGYLFSAQWMALFPTELIGFKYAFEKTHSTRLEIKAEHPLLNTRLMSLSGQLESPTDELFVQVLDFARKNYPKDWEY
jgi:hypothetical protein